MTGEEELLQRIRVCLSVPKGSFVYESGLGSRLREAHDPPELLEAAREALGPIPEAEPIRAQWQGELCLVELRPVSYTHLDVYKRQEPENGGD